MLTTDQRARLRGRRTFDFNVIQAMATRCQTIEVNAYQSAADLKAQRNVITDEAHGHEAKHYWVKYKIPTLIGPGKFADETIIHIDSEVAGYPEKAPASWVLTTMPYSPHFMKGAVVCIGEIWDQPDKVLLAHVVRHHARLLNWAEVARGGGYVGWNGAAIDYHKKHYGTKPLNPGIQYPELPEDIVYGIDSTAVEVVDFDLFGEVSRQSGAPALDDLFAAQGRASR